MYQYTKKTINKQKLNLNQHDMQVASITEKQYVRKTQQIFKIAML